MADPAVVCALVLARFLQFMDFHGNVTVYAQDYDSSMYVLETAGNLADQLALCEGRAWEIAMLAKIGRAAADQAHALEDRAQHDGTPLRNF